MNRIEEGEKLICVDNTVGKVKIANYSIMYPSKILINDDVIVHCVRYYPSGIYVSLKDYNPLHFYHLSCLKRLDYNFVEKELKRILE